jgi:hypothetical protein
LLEKNRNTAPSRRSGNFLGAGRFLYMSKPTETDIRERKIDEALEDSSPASDPPAFVGAGAPRGDAPKAGKQIGHWGVRD